VRPYLVEPVAIVFLGIAAWLSRAFDPKLSDIGEAVIADDAGQITPNPIRHFEQTILTEKVCCRPVLSLRLVVIEGCHTFSRCRVHAVFLFEPQRFGDNGFPHDCVSC
jgi:hypothetical protein